MIGMLTKLHARFATFAAAMLALAAAPALSAQVAAADAPAQSTEAPERPPLAEGYILGAGDIIEVAVVGREEYKARVQVQVDGTVQLPFIRDVAAADRTIAQLQDDVAARLKAGGYYTDPVVSVMVAGYASRYVVVLGQVGTPGLLPIDRNYRLSEVIARVGGIGPNGSETVTLTRVSGEQLSVTLEQMATGGDAADPYVAAGDKIFVDRVEEGERPTFCIYGEVNGAGCYPVGENMSLRMAIARAGGLTKLGSEKKVKVFREGEDIGKLDLSQTVRSGDVIKVGQRFF